MEGLTWTKAHRARHEAGLKSMVSMEAVGPVAAWTEQADPPHRERARPVVAVVGAVAWHLRVGGPWRALPRGRPCWRTVYGWFRRWRELGLFDAVLRHATVLRRRARGRKAMPRLAVIGTQSVKGIPVRGPRGFDAAKKVPGRKRVALADTAKPPCGLRGDGAWLAVAVVPANVQDRDCLAALSLGQEAWTNLRSAVLDGAFTAGRCQERCNLHGMRRHLVERAPDQKGFVVLERRRVVERTGGWLAHGRVACARAGGLRTGAGCGATGRDAWTWLPPASLAPQCSPECAPECAPASKP